MIDSTRYTGYGEMTAMTPILALPKEDPDILCADCGKPAGYITAGGIDEDGDPFVVGYCIDHLPGDENAGPKHLPTLAVAGNHAHG